jgi:hypothetical protein
MSRTYHRGERRLRVLGIKRRDPDLRKLGRALIALAQAQAEADARAEHTVRQRRLHNPNLSPNRKRRV